MAEVCATSSSSDSKSKKRTKWLSKLPSKRNVLSVVFWNLEKNKFSLKEAAEIVEGQVSSFWMRARIPTRQKQHIKAKVVKLYQDYANLRKNKCNKKKRSAALEKKREQF